MHTTFDSTGSMHRNSQTTMHLASFDIYTVHIVDAPRWHRGAVGRVSDSRSRGRGFESRPGTQRKKSGHVSHTCVPLFTKQYKVVPAKGR